MFRKLISCVLLVIPLHLSAQTNSQIELVTGNDFGDFSGETLDQGGMVTEVVNAAFGISNIDLEVTFDDWSAGYGETTKGGYDGTFPYYFTMPRTGEHVYGDSIYEIVERFFYMSNNEKISDLSRPSDLEGLTVCYPSGWAAAEPVQAMFDSGRATRNTPGDMTRCFDLLANAQVDVVLSPELQGYETIDSLPNLDNFDVEAANWEVDIKTLSVLFPKIAGPEVACSNAVSFNTGLASLRVNGAFNDIVRKWFNRVAQLASPDQMYVMVHRNSAGPEEIQGTAIGLRGSQFYLDSNKGIVGVPVEDILWFSTTDFDASKDYCTNRPQEASTGTPSPVVDSEAPRTMNIAGPEGLVNDLSPKLLSNWLDKAVEVDLDNNDTYIVQSPSADEKLPQQMAVVGKDAATAFELLARGEAELAITDRQPNSSERRLLSQVQVVPSSSTEHIFALEGLAMVVHPSRQLAPIELGEIDLIVEGSIRNWSALGESGSSIELLMDKALALSIEEGALSGTARRIGNNARLMSNHEDVVSTVAKNPDAIGLVPLAMTNSPTIAPVAISECGLNYDPREFTVRTEEYPLSRRLYMYYLPSAQPVFAGAFARHSQQDGQSIMSEEGKIDLTIQVQDADAYVEAFENRNRSGEQRPSTVSGLRNATLGARRLSTTFRFLPGVHALDARAVRDAERLADYMQSKNLQAKDIALVGYADSDGGYARNCTLSTNRAQSVAAALAREGISGQVDVFGACEEAPVACNITTNGKSLNRRVEVWKR